MLRAVYPDYQDERVTVKQNADDGWFAMNSASGMIFKVPGQQKSPSGEVLPFRGLSNDIQVHFATGGAVPGDRIVGILDGEKSLAIYPIQSPGLQQFEDEPERWIDVRWDLDLANKSRFNARIMISAINEPGTLATIAQNIATTDVNIATLTMTRVAADFTEMQLELEVWDLRQLNQLITQLKELQCVATVKRLFE